MVSPSGLGWHVEAAPLRNPRAPSPGHLVVAFVLLAAGMAHISKGQASDTEAYHPTLITSVPRVMGTSTLAPVGLLKAQPLPGQFALPSHQHQLLRQPIHGDSVSNGTSHHLQPLLITALATLVLAASVVQRWFSKSRSSVPVVEQWATVSLTGSHQRFSHQLASTSDNAQTAVAEKAAAVEEKAAEPAKPPRALRVLSGVQPTGNLTLGNYLGAIKQWVDLQNDPETKTDSLFCVVDLHAITMEHDPKALTEATRMAAAVYLAAGLDPERVTIFVQSHVPAHAELCWLLTCACPMGWMEKMIQFKEKSAKAGVDVGLGLFAYPVLMAADILLYQTDLVPVGEDQTQHIELTRDLARRFNDRYAKKMKKVTGKSRVFKEPKAQIVKEGARIMSLLDGTSKMSKSAVNDGSRINLLDPPDVIRNKFKRCKTDSFEGLEWDNPERPECTNLLTIYKAVTGKTKEEVAAEVSTLSWGTFKPLLAEAVIKHLEPLQTRYHALMAQPEYLDKVLTDGARKANAIAERTLADAYAAMGFVSRPKL